MFFFFSSRRRHTRSLCDWSSDVCSSDLRSSSVTKESENGTSTIAAPGRGRSGRSEERRVGKECRTRWARNHSKKKKSGSLSGMVTEWIHQTDDQASAETGSLTLESRIAV